VQLAEYGPRAGAWLIDWAIFWVPTILLFLLAYALRNPYAYIQGESGGSIFFQVIGWLWIVAATIYFAVQVGRSGQSPGMRLTGVKCLRDRTGEPIGVGLGFLRLLNYLIPFSIGFLFPLWDERRQTVGDKAASSVVVAVPSQPFSLVAGFNPGRGVGGQDRPIRQTTAQAYPMPPSAPPYPQGDRSEPVQPSPPSPRPTSRPAAAPVVVSENSPSEPDTIRRERDEVFCRSCGQPNA
jgi:uncharacterized RDD family membrane protein YckC